MKRESGQRTLSLDPNIRPALIQDREAYRRRFESWLEMMDIVRLSLADLGWLYPGEEAEGLVLSWLKRGPSLCVLTLGSQGAIGFAAGGAEARVPAPETRVVDTVGAGDTFAAAVLAYLYDLDSLGNPGMIAELSGDKLRECLEYASRAAAINCTRPGADPPFRSEL
jgi:fructokinase